MSAPPPKPWERGGSGAAPAAASDPSAPKPWEQPGSAAVARTAAGDGQPSRPWESQQRVGVTGTGIASTSAPYGSSSYGAPYGSSSTYGSVYGSAYGAGQCGSYASPYASRFGGGGLYGSSYGSGLYGGGGMYGAGGMYGGSSMYGGGMYGAGAGMYGSSGMYGGGMYGAGGMYGGSPYGAPGGFMRPGMGPGGLGAGPFDPNQPPPAPPSAWQALLAGINGVMHFFGRLSFLVDENAHAVHFFISALLQLLDRAGSLYGELARFILRVLLRRQRALKLPPGMQHQQQPGGPKPLPAPGAPLALPAPGSAGGSWSPPPMPAGGSLPTGSHWDGLWGDS